MTKRLGSWLDIVDACVEKYPIGTTVNLNEWATWVEENTGRLIVPNGLDVHPDVRLAFLRCHIPDFTRTYNRHAVKADPPHELQRIAGAIYVSSLINSILTHDGAHKVRQRAQSITQHLRRQRKHAPWDMWDTRINEACQMMCEDFEDDVWADVEHACDRLERKKMRLLERLQSEGIDLGDPKPDDDDDLSPETHP
jgi:hypothetical protein